MCVCVGERASKLHRNSIKRTTIFDHLVSHIYSLQLLWNFLYIPQCFEFRMVIKINRCISKIIPDSDPRKVLHFNAEIRGLYLFRSKSRFRLLFHQWYTGLD